MSAICCPNCKTLHRLSFWDLHARLGQLYERYEQDVSGIEAHLIGSRSAKSASELIHKPTVEEHGNSPGYSTSKKGLRFPSQLHHQHVKPPSEEMLPEIDPSPASSQHVAGQGSLPLSNRSYGVVPAPLSQDDLVSGGRRISEHGRVSEHRLSEHRLPEFRAECGSRGSEHRTGTGRKRSLMDRKSKEGDATGAVKAVTIDDAGNSRVLSQLMLQPHECWQKVAKLHTRPLPSMRNLSKANVGTTATTLGSGQQASEVSGLGRFVLYPGRPFRNVWDILAVLFLVHDMIVIPLRFFDMPNALFLEILAWFTQVFWNLDVIATFMTGYYEDGNLVLKPTKIAWNYMKTWLLFDLIVVSVDWIILFLAADSDAQGVHRLSKTVRLLRFLRMVRILRLAKISRMSEAVQEQIQSQTANIHYSLFKSIFRLLLLTHLLACSWYGIGRLSGEEWGDISWVQADSFTERTLGYQYTTCYHWAFCQMGVGGIAIYPTNTYERSFGIFAAFVALMTFSTLVSKMTSLMSSLNKLKDEETEQFRLLRRYLIYNDIPLHLSQRIIRFLQHGYRIRNEALSAGNHLPILDLLSQSLQGELQFERYRGCLNELKFSEQLPAESRQTVQVMHKLAMRAIINTVVGNDDVIFCAADWATSAYCAQSGRLHYHGDEEGEPVTTIQGCNSWIAEMSLWTPWSHMGDLVSEEVSRIVVMNVEQFCKCVRESSECQAAAVAYAKDYVDQLRKCNQLNDLFVLTKMQHNLSRQASIQSAAPHKRCCRFLSWNNEVHPAD